jgi:predicted nucleotidyltransferase
MEQLEDTSTSKKRMPTVSDIAKAVNLPEDKLLNIYLFGSQLFGTANPDSGSLQDD